MCIRDRCNDPWRRTPRKTPISCIDRPENFASERNHGRESALDPFAPAPGLESRAENFREKARRFHGLAIARAPAPRRSRECGHQRVRSSTRPIAFACLDRTTRRQRFRVTMARRPHGEVYFEPRHVGVRARQPSKRIRASSYSPAHLTSRACCRSHDARDCVAKSSRGRARGCVFLVIGSYEAIIQTNLPFVTSTNHSTHYAVSRYSFAPSQF